MASPVRAPITVALLSLATPVSHLSPRAAVPHLCRAISTTPVSLSKAAVPAPTAAPSVVDFTHVPISNLQTLTAAGLEVTQSPNNDGTWSRSQRPRSLAYRGARFEQTDIALQPTPLSAQAMIAEEPVRTVQGHKAVCDGGGGALGHPKVYIPLDKPGEVVPCGYCGLRFIAEEGH
ncbi:hypothetical protein M427DRAFT_97582 [Gonapodya prolifera JEL478]|uniref:Zinc finger CHCC-type domain-containing protein n=1 Tax=Gonapodya prolifera (strain JEL478) TaxID=1344416 RepID=A0A139AIK8_GONPJ|nr:hypothetical protein M427DRAFT_97582 [Gonapodya prolifera JEL478]|eukprot:KXS16627.1 hypothetical protein M427DRAFT_97582 [Gonapodya prolifera JEL478]